MLESLRETIRRNVINIPGWRTDRKIVVFESDDWGMVRMSSKEAYHWFLKKGYKVDLCPYNRNDSIESNEDLKLLFEVLMSVKDKNGNPAAFTANNIVANPDFEKIKESGFTNYFYEPFPKTLERYPNRDKVISLYKKGIAQGNFIPQFHGREHLNVNRWMAELNSENEALLNAFKQNMFTVHKSGTPNGRRDHLDAFGMGYESEWVSMKEIIQSGLDLFEDIWGYCPSSFIAPCYTWTEQVEKILAKRDIKFLQGTHVQRLPTSYNGSQIRRRYHYTGQENRLGQRYLVRNAQFEPTEDGKKDLVNKTLSEIKTAFKYKKPAIISSHRVNYIGSIRPENRNENLKLLEKLLKGIVKHFPNVEFMTSDQLGELIIKEN